MLWFFLAIVAVLSISGCTFSGAMQFSEGLQASYTKSSKVTLYSIEPNSINTEVRTQMYGYPVLGSIQLNDGEAGRLVGKLADGVWRWRWKNFVLRSEVACFNPRHIVRIETKRDVFDYVICFECEGVEVYKNGSQYSYSGVLAKQNEFDNALVGGGVPLATY